MKLNIKKITSVLLIVLLCSAIYLNLSHNSKNENGDRAKILGEAAYVNNNVEIEEPEPFSARRIERQKAKEQALELIEQVITDDTSDAETIKNAQQRKIIIAENMIKESDSETVLNAKGFEKVLVTIGEDGATVLVCMDTLLPAQVVQIQEAVSSAAGILPEKIKIVLSR